MPEERPTCDQNWSGSISLYKVGQEKEKKRCLLVLAKFLAKLFQLTLHHIRETSPEVCLNFESIEDLFEIFETV